MHRLSVSNLACVRSNIFSNIAVFEGVNFTLSGGAVMAVSGANGSGKTSLLRILAGLLDHSDGTITWNDTPRDADTWPQTLHWTGTDDALKPDLSVAENLRFWAGCGRTAPPALLLAQLNIAALADMPVRLLSRGQARRVSLSRLFLKPRPLWILDEPETGLDDHSIALFQQCLAAHKQTGGIAVIASLRAALWQPDAEWVLSAPTGGVA